MSVLHFYKGSCIISLILHLYCTNLILMFRDKILAIKMFFVFLMSKLMYCLNPACAYMMSSHLNRITDGCDTNFDSSKQIIRAGSGIMYVSIITVHYISGINLSFIWNISIGEMNIVIIIIENSILLFFLNTYILIERN